MRIISGSANRRLAAAIAEECGVELTDARVARFPDGEVEIAVDPEVRDETVYLVQPTSPPVDANLVELLMLADAVRRCGSARIVAVIPYLGYARQDRRTQHGEPIGIRVVGDLLATCGVDRVLVVDPHTRALGAIFSVPVEAATAVPLLAAALADDLPDDGVLVAPDLGATKLAERFAQVWDLPVAIVRKSRVSGHEVQADQVVGDVADRHPIIVDDMISTGGTIAAAVDVLHGAGSTADVSVVATHGLFSADAARTLGRLALRRLVVTDTVPPPADLPLDLEVAGVGRLLADAIARLDAHRPLEDLPSF